MSQLPHPPGPRSTAPEVSMELPDPLESHNNLFCHAFIFNNIHET